jgi:NAD(P)-dependent dehydrogenase (short-subunit alcohol dehydrogenase family)
MAFALRGAKVAVADINESADVVVADVIQKVGDEAQGYGVDVASADQVSSLVSKVVEKCGTLDIFHNNVGVACGRNATADVRRMNKPLADPEFGKALLELHPVGRLGSIEEVADAVLWLSSLGASFVHGTLLTVDGGWTSR